MYHIVNNADQRSSHVVVQPFSVPSLFLSPHFSSLCSPVLLHILVVLVVLVLVLVLLTLPPLLSPATPPPSLRFRFSILRSIRCSHIQPPDLSDRPVLYAARDRAASEEPQAAPPSRLDVVRRSLRPSPVPRSAQNRPRRSTVPRSPCIVP